MDKKAIVGTIGGLAIGAMAVVGLTPVEAEKIEQVNKNDKAPVEQRVFRIETPITITSTTTIAQVDGEIAQIDNDILFYQGIIHDREVLRAEKVAFKAKLEEASK